MHTIDVVKGLLEGENIPRANFLAAEALLMHSRGCDRREARAVIRAVHGEMHEWPLRVVEAG